MRLEGKVALVTGGGTGIGAAIARRFSAEGARVVLLGRRIEPLAEIAAEVDGLALAGDAANTEDVRQAVRAATEQFGGLDILVANAGTLEFADVLGTDDDAWERDLRNNLMTCVVSSREVLPALIDRGGGSIVIVSSGSAVVATPSLVTYTTAKTALLGLMRSLAIDHGPHGVRVNAVLPGVIKTAMIDDVVEAFAEARGIAAEEVLGRLASVSPLGRAADPSEIAAVCLFLASSDASFVTGAALVADGGHTIVNQATLALRDP